MDRWTVDELLATGRRGPRRTRRSAARSSRASWACSPAPIRRDEFAELKPRITWDRVTDVIEGRRDARIVAVTSGGTIPDRGLFGVFMVGEAGTPGRRVGELDEEMVYESRAGEVDHARRQQLADRGDRPRPGDRVAGARRAGQAAVLARRRASGGRSSWAGRSAPSSARLEDDLARGAARSEGGDRAAAAASRPRRPGGREPARLPRGRARGRRRPADRPADRRRALPGRAGRLAARAADAVRRPGPRAVVAGARGADRGAARGRGPDDLVRRRDRDPAARGRVALDGVEELLFPDPDEVEDLVVGQVASSALFASRFRENAARALLLPRRRPGTRTPLWQQRQRAADLLAVASRYGSLPDPRRDVPRGASRTCSTCRPCASCSAASSGARSRSTASRRSAASPFASSLLFDYVAAYMYDGDAPLAERRAQALTLDRDLLRELLGQEELRELLDPEALADLELSLQALADDRHATTADQVHDLLRRLGRPVGRRGRGAGPRAASRPRTCGSRSSSRRAGPSGPDRRRGALDRDRGRRAVPRRRRGLAAARRPAGVPRPGGGGARRAARALRPDARAVPGPGPGPALGPAGRRGRGRARAAARRRHDPRAASSGRAAPSASGSTRTCCGCSAAARWPGSGARSSRSIRRRSAGSCRRGTASPPVGGGCRPPLRRHRGPRAARRGRRPARRPADPGVGPRAGRAAGTRPGLPAAAARRARGDGRGRLGGAGEPRSRRRPDRARPARSRGAPTHRTASTAPTAPPVRATSAIREHLARRGASFYRELFAAAGGGSDREVLDALWDLVWAGEVTNDTFAPLRALRWKRTVARRAAATGPADLARAARGGRPLVARRGGRRRRRPSGSTPTASRCSTGTAS